MKDPEVAGTQFVLERVKRVIEQRLLATHGQLTCTDILFAFVDVFHELLAVQPDQDAYDIEVLSNAVNRQMLGVCASVASEIARKGYLFVPLNLEAVAQFARTKNVKPIPPGSIPISFSVESRFFPIRSVFDALQYFAATETKRIERPFARRSRDLMPGANWIWSGYSAEDEARNVGLMIEKSLDEYAGFVRRNRLRLPRSRYLDSSTAIIMEYEPVAISDSRIGPGIREHHIGNQSRTLPKLTVSILGDRSSRLDAATFPKVTIAGAKYAALYSSHGVASHFFQRTPMLTLLYKMLKRDLADHYDIGLVSDYYH